MSAKMKKGFCLILVLVMLLTSVPVTAFAMEEESPTDFGVEPMIVEPEINIETEPPPPAFGREPAPPEIAEHLHNNGSRLSSDSLVENLLDAIVEEVFDGEPFFYLEPFNGI